MKFRVQDGLYDAGRTEDGERYTASAYFVVAENDRGERWAHCQSFPGCRVEQDEEGYPHFMDVRAEALLAARRVLNGFRRDGTNVHAYGIWYPMAAAYGSDAHSDVEMVEWEKKVDEEARWS